MNWQGGFFRLGLIAYAIWLGLVGWQAYSNVTVPNNAVAAAAAQNTADYNDCMGGRTGMAAIDECNQRSFSSYDENSENVSPPTYWPYLGLAFAPWVLLALLWMAFDFVKRGLHSSVNL